jgi:hypothetical protein
LPELKWTNNSGVCIYTLEQGSFVRSVSPNVVRLVGIQQKFIINVWGEGTGGCVAEEGWSSEDGRSFMLYMKLHLLTYRRQSVSVIKTSWLMLFNVNNFFLYLRGLLEK